MQGKRERKPEPEVRPARTVGTIEHLDETTVRKRVLARDRKAQPRALDAAFRRVLALIERVEDSRSIARINFGKRDFALELQNEGAGSGAAAGAAK